MIERTWKLNKARIWINDLPNWPSINEEEFIVEQRPVNTGLQIFYDVGIEACIPTGGMTQYAALLFHYTPSDSSDTLEIHIPSQFQSGLLYQKSLLEKMDTAHYGLKREYLEGVVNGLKDAHLYLGKGNLAVVGAAHALVGSNLMIFERCATFLIRLMCDTKSDQAAHVLSLLENF